MIDAIGMGLVGAGCVFAFIRLLELSNTVADLQKRVRALEGNLVALEGKMEFAGPYR